MYSWGVLHHTGAMWKALENASTLVRPGGLLFIALYNNQGGASRRWKIIKRTYNDSRLARPSASVIVPTPAWNRAHSRPCLRGRPFRYLKWTKDEACRSGETSSIGSAVTRLKLRIRATYLNSSKNVDFI